MNKEIILGILSLLLTILGWFFDKADNIPWVSKLVAPKYYVATDAYEKMMRDKLPLMSGEKGFDEIVGVLKKDLQGDGDLTIASIQILDHAFSVLSSDTGMESAPTITLKITLKDGRNTQAANVKDLRERFREQYLQSRLFISGALIFWVGVAGTIATLWIAARSSKQS